MFKRGDIFEIVKGELKGIIVAFVNSYDINEDGNYQCDWGFFGVDKHEEYFIPYTDVKHLGFDENITQFEEAESSIGLFYYPFGSPYVDAKNNHKLLQFDEGDNTCTFYFEGSYGHGDFWVPLASQTNEFEPDSSTAKTISISKTITSDCTGSVCDETITVKIEEIAIDTESDEEEISFLAPQPKAII